MPSYVKIDVYEKVISRDDLKLIFILTNFVGHLNSHLQDYTIGYCFVL